MNPEWIGSLAAVLTTAAYVPQVIKVFREKHTTSLSLSMYLLVTTGIWLWFVYGVMIDSPSVMLCNSLSGLMALFILLMKLRHG